MKDCVIRICNKCGETKEIGDFFFRRDNNHYRRECKICFHHRHDRDDYFKRKQLRIDKTKLVGDLISLGVRECSECHEIRKLERFQSKYHIPKHLYAICNECINSKNRLAYKKDPKKFLDSVAKWRKNNPEKFKQIEHKIYQRRKHKLSEQSRKKYRENPEPSKRRSRQWRKDNVERARERDKNYVKNNRDKVNNYRREWQRQYRKSHRVRFAYLMRSILISTLKRNNLSKSRKTEDYFGCSLSKLHEYIESQFTDGMNWDNRGPGYLRSKDGKAIRDSNGDVIRIKQWHLDHIRPCSSFDFTDPEQQKQCFHYTNLRPLWAEDNLRKSDFLIDGSRGRFKDKTIV